MRLGTWNGSSVSSTRAAVAPAYVAHLETKRTLARILAPAAPSIGRRYANRWDLQRGSRYINLEPCAFCSWYLRGRDCTTCPLDARWGIGPDSVEGVPGCSVVIQRLWGPFTFLDLPGRIISSNPANPQLATIQAWLASTFLGGFP